MLAALIVGILTHIYTMLRLNEKGCGYMNITEVKTSRQLRDFIKFPFKLYKNCPQWVPPLISDEMKTLRRDRNPVFDFCDAKYFIAERENKVVGRVAAIINKAYNLKTGRKYMRIGWFDFIDDLLVSKALMAAVHEYAKSEGMEMIHGPLGFTDMDKQGLLIEGHEEKSTIISLYNFSYYEKHFDSLGFVKDVDWLEFRIKVQQPPERLRKLAHLVHSKYGIYMKSPTSKKEVKALAYRIFEIWNKEFSILYGYVPVEGRLLDSYIDQYFSYIDPDFVSILYDKEDTPIGFGLAMPSLSDAFIKSKGRLLPFGFIHILKGIRNCETVDLYTIGVTGEHHKSGAVTVLLYESLLKYNEKGVKVALASAQLENNHDVHSLWKFFDGEQYKRRRCYVKQLVLSQEED